VKAPRMSHTLRPAISRTTSNSSSAAANPVAFQTFSESENRTLVLQGAHRLNIWEFAARTNGSSMDSVKSSIFKAGKHRWRVECHPAGVRQEVAEYISLFVRYLGPEDTVTAHWELRCVNRNPANHKERKWSKNDAHNVFKKNNRWGWDKFMKKSLILNPEEGFLHPDGTVQFEAGVKINTETMTVAKRNFREIPVSDVAQDMAQLFKSGKLSDITFVCDDGQTKLKAHRQILAARCQVFDRMFAGGFAETNPSSVNNSWRFEIPDIDGHVFEDLLNYLYCGKTKTNLYKFETKDMMDVEASQHLSRKRKRDSSFSAMHNSEMKSDVCLHDADPMSNLENHGAEAIAAHFDHFRFVIGLLQAADKYEVEELSETCQIYLCHLIDEHSVVDILMIADKFNASQLKKDCLEFMTWNHPVNITPRQSKSLSKNLLLEMMKKSTIDDSSTSIMDIVFCAKHFFASSFLEFSNGDFEKLVDEMPEEELTLKLRLFGIEAGSGDRDDMKARLSSLIIKSSSKPADAEENPSFNN